MKPGSFQISLKAFLCRDDQLLILRDAVSGLGDLPGGRIGQEEFFEDWLTALSREIAEELGSDFEYRLEPEPLFVFPHRIVSAHTDGLGIAYRAEFERGNVQLSTEHDWSSWVSMSDYDPDSFFHPHLAHAVRRFQRLVE